MNYSKELQELEESSKQVVKENTNLLCELITKYNIPADELIVLNRLFFKYGGLCNDIGRQRNKEITDEIFKINKTIV